MKTSPSNDYECPECGEWIWVPPLSKYVKCPCCKAQVAIHPDADFHDGHWHDRTTLSVAVPGRAHIERMLEWAKSQKP